MNIIVTKKGRGRGRVGGTASASAAQRYREGQYVRLVALQPHRTPAVDAAYDSIERTNQVPHVS